MTIRRAQPRPRPRPRSRHRRLAAAALAVGALAPLLVLAAGGTATAAAPVTAGSGPIVVRTAGGLIRGRVSGEVREFEGIPYAAPPVGSLRWQAPRPAAPWTGVRDATEPGSECPQQAGGQVAGDEDCLFLNVTTPARAAAGARLPVMVWIHGGGGVSGSGASYDTAALAAGGDVVAVTINYRLGALGFLDLPQLAAQTPDAGDFALADQQAALRWVHRNAAAFGGDPGNVTIFGQSAGGYAVCANLAAPGSRGLFQRAIIQSAPCSNPVITSQAARQRGIQAAAQLGCAPPADMLACLRTVPAAALAGLKQSAFAPGSVARDATWGYVAGTPGLPEQPLAALRDGTAAQVPLIQGSNSDEMRVFAAGWSSRQGGPVTAGQYPSVLAQAFGPARAPAIAAEYPLSRYPSPELALAAVLTDWGQFVGACPVLPADDAAARHAHVFAYEFSQDDGLTVAGFPMGATHGSELPYLFGDLPGFPPPGPALSRQMIAYWTRFARAGNPNGPGTPYWPAYRAGRPVLSLAAGPGGIAPAAFAAEHHCAFWAGQQPG